MHLARALRVNSKDVITLVGGGGKSTAMFRLAHELAESGWQVVTTMTTHIFSGQTAHAPAHLALSDDRLLESGLPGLLERYHHVLVTSDEAVAEDKVQGLPPETVDRLVDLPGTDAVVVEGDGARRLPFKAPAEHEPVVPSRTTILVPVAGADVVGQPLNSKWVHRPERIAQITGAKLGQSVTPPLVASVLVHPDGGARHLPPGARLVPLLNKADDPARLAAAREIARLLIHSPIVDSALIGRVQSVDPIVEVWSRVGAVVLAAGGARRFGALKQVLPWRGKSLVAHVADQALACDDISRVVVTVGSGAERVRASLGARPVLVQDVPDWDSGQSRSVQAGLKAVVGPGDVNASGALGAVLFLLADQPGVTPDLLSALIQRHRETLAPVVAPRWQGQRGNPVLFDRAVFAEFATLANDVGARPIVEAHRHEIAWLDWPDSSIIADIDTPSDYQPADS